MTERLYHYLVEGKGPKPFMQIVVVRAVADHGARLAVRRYLEAEGLELVAFDEEETAIVDAGLQKDGTPPLQKHSPPGSASA